MENAAQSIDRMIQRGNLERFNRKQTAFDRIELNRRNVPQNKIDEESVVEPAKRIPVFDRCDVLVVGAGPAGISAALAASRAGADTMLVERYGCFGGVITTVGMETIGWYRYEGTVDCEGIGIEMEKRAAMMGASRKWAYNESECLDAEYFKVVADDLIKESGVRPLLHTLVVETIVENNIIKGVIIETKSGRLAILAKRVIDCTGDADVAYYSGASCNGIAPNSSMATTTVFSCSGVDTTKFLQYTETKKATYADWGETWTQNCDDKTKQLQSPYLESEFENARKQGVIPADIDNIGGSWSSLTAAGEATNLNLVHMKGYNALDVRQLTAAEMEGRKKTMFAIQALKHSVPGFENAKLRNFGMTLGIRDTRKIIGQVNLTGEMVMNQAKFDDSIGIFPEFIDGYNVLVLPTSGRYFQVPLGCLLPLEIDNLLVAGRCVAGDSISHSAMRNLMACTVTGQGAGVAAAISVKTDTTTQNVDVRAVQDELIRQNVRIH